MFIIKVSKGREKIMKMTLKNLFKLLGLDKQQNGNLSLNIENFNNSREQDIQSLVEEIAFYMKRKQLI